MVKQHLPQFSCAETPKAWPVLFTQGDVSNTSGLWVMQAVVEHYGGMSKLSAWAV